jgi:DNA-directed RNA polymerase subunit RPC12/RpoP
VAPEPKAEVEAPKAVEVSVTDSVILTGAGTLALHEAMKAALGGQKAASFKVAALQSGYTAELTALAFEDISRIQASSVDAHAARMKLLRTLHSRIAEYSCGPIKFQDWLKQTAQGDYDTLMYGLYAATYPGENEFDVRCRHCGHDNKISVEVGQLARVESNDVYGEIRKLLDPKTDFKGAIQNSLVGRTVQRKLPQSGIIVEIRNPSMQDYLDGVQWFVNAQDKTTGSLPPDIAGAEVIRTLTMYVPRILVPAPAGSNYLPVTDQGARANLIGRLPRADGQALTDAVDAESKRLEVSYTLPDYNCASCGKKNEELFLDFEALLFIKLREKV